MPQNKQEKGEWGNLKVGSRNKNPYQKLILS